MKRFLLWLLAMFSGDSDDSYVINNVAYVGPPTPTQLAARNKALNRIKATYGDKLRCNQVMPRLEQPL